MKRGKQAMHIGQKTPPQANQHGNVFTLGTPKKVKAKARKYASRPKCPEYITGKSEEFWKRFSGPYWKAERLTKDTAPLFCQLCTAWGRWRDFVEMQAELFKANPKTRGLVMRDGASILTKPNGQIEERGGQIKVTIPADRAEKAEAHFFKQFEKFLDLTERFAEPGKIVDNWGK
jgi:phage terminase small subunit